MACGQHKFKSSFKRDRRSEWPQLKNALTIWIDHANQSNYTITGAILLPKKQLIMPGDLILMDFRRHRILLNCYRLRNKLRLRNNKHYLIIIYLPGGGYRTLRSKNK